MRQRTIKRRCRLLMAAFVALIHPVLPPQAFGQTLGGGATVRVIDGDTLSIGERRIRLHGIDAPEGGQGCQRSDGSPWDCGADATAALTRLVTTGVECVQLATDRFGREVARCTNGQGMDVSGEMVRLGWAVAFIRYSRDYAELELQARAANAGLWAGIFEAPEEYRRRTRRP